MATPREWPNNMEMPMMTTVILTPLVALIAGILILIVPRLLNFIVALYLIIIGLVGILPHLPHSQM